MARRTTYTTFELSQICEVNPTTVQNWVKEGKLRAYATPGGHRRVTKEDLLAFLHKYGMPVPTQLETRTPVVMIVDDEPDVRGMLEEVMATAEVPVEVETAAGGIEALLRIGEKKPDLLILDIRMPHMDGFEVCRQLKANPRNQKIKIVAITGDNDPALREKIIAAGADLFFTKPLDVVAFRDEALRLIGA